MKLHIKILALTLVLLIGGLLSYSLIKNGYFPVAKINGQLISYRSIRENIDVSRRIYLSGLAGESGEMASLFSQGNDKDLLKNALESLVINNIIKSSASDDSLDQAQAEIKESFNDSDTANLADSIKTIYGWSMAKFENRILEPQALRRAVLKEKGESFNNWLADAKSKASVSIWFLPFKWENGQLQDK